MKRAIFFDVDGTLINHHSTLPSPATRAALARAAASGHTLILCTGRCKFEVYQELWDLGFSGLVGSNGAYVELGGEVLVEDSFAPEDIADLTDFLDEAGAGQMWQAPDGLYPGGAFTKWFDTNDEADGPRGSDAIDWSSYARHIRPYLRRGRPTLASKVSFFLGKTGATFADVEAEFGERFTLVDSSMADGSHQGGEISPRGIDKSVGLRAVAKALDLPVDATVAIGDSENDLTMLRVAGVGVAMGNGIPSVKEVADWVTRSVDEDGVAYALQQLELV